MQDNIKKEVSITAVSLINKNYSTNVCVFCYDTWSEDKDKLPTMSSAGKDLLSTIRSCAQGSIAKGTNGENYILTGNNTWILYSSATSSGSDSGTTDKKGIEFTYGDGTAIEDAQFILEKII